MQRAKHAERRKETRLRLELGDAVEAAGAAHLTRDEIITALHTYIGRGADPVPEDTSDLSTGNDTNVPTGRLS